MNNKMLSKIGQEYQLRKLNSGVFHKLVVRGMDFEINSYEAKGLGRVGTMCASGLAGLVKRDIFVISPTEKDLPIVTYERVKAFGKDSMIFTRYFLDNEPVCVKKVGKKKQSAEFDREVEGYIKEYLCEARQAESINSKERKLQIEELVTELINGYQLIADIFLATYGMQITEKLYHGVLFGTRDWK